MPLISGDPLFYQFDLVVNRINPKEGNKETVTVASRDVTVRRPHMGYRDVDAAAKETTTTLSVGDETTQNVDAEGDTTTAYDYELVTDDETTLKNDVLLTTLVGTSITIDELDVSVVRQKISDQSMDLGVVGNGSVTMNDAENDVDNDDGDDDDDADDDIDDHHDYGSEMTTEDDPGTDADDASVSTLTAEMDKTSMSTRMVKKDGFIVVIHEDQDTEKPG